MRPLPTRLTVSDGRAGTEIVFHPPGALANSAMVLGASRRMPTSTRSNLGPCDSGHLAPWFCAVFVQTDGPATAKA
jgi:hypothetical protein